MIDHLHPVVHDLPASRRFYQAVLDVVGIPLGGGGDGFFLGRRTVRLRPRHDGARCADRPPSPGIQARDVAMVHAFHQAALAHGGRDNGTPGLRPYHRHYSAGLVPDPDGNNLEAVFHCVAQHSANAVQITF
ncbi:VOC family protein [Xanthomonas oryzae]|uniref:VOC family protein n=1 Tax=Xanthomonas oryzae TaxID=347 RepID=UPI002DD92BF5|nr:VOC family protein [Xanthomonas oryzae]